MAAKIRDPEGMMNPGGAGAGAMAQPRGATVQSQAQPEMQMYTEDEMREHGIKCAVLSKWETVLRMLYFEKQNTPGAEVHAAALYEIMVHFGFIDPDAKEPGKETA